MSQSSSKASGLPRKSAFSCEACRKRKVKCNGASPSCSRCTARGEACVYSLAPTLSYTKTLEARIAELEEQLTKIHGEGGSDTVNTSRLSPQVSSTESTSSIGQTPERDVGNALSESTSDFEGLTVEHDGRISFHGPTSLFHLLPNETVNDSLSSHPTAELEARKERLTNNAWRERATEQLSGIPEPFQYLLDFHWCWIQPLFNFVYRPAFTRDMKVSGPYYSDILLNAILSHSIRWCIREPKVQPLLDSFNGGTKFIQAAVSGTFETLKSGYPQIPTVQTLLLLSAHECGRGNRAQAWLYSGMAFRLVQELGISIDSRKYSRSVPFTDEDIEVRNRLFWSCYFWDKLICLYFGRSPTIQHSRVSPPRMLLDDTAEVEIWYPHGVTFPDGTEYPMMQAHSTSCFVKMCGLAEILNQILIYIYDPLRQSGEAEIRNCIVQQEQSLSQWWDELPDFLRLSAGELPQICPPSHIVTLNCLYHTINILIHRPILCSKSLASNGSRPDMNHLFQCMTSATSILALFDLYRRTFGDSHVVLSLAYSLYTATSIFLLEIKALKYAAPATVEKVKFCVFALERVKGANRVITTGLGLIYQELQKLQVDIAIPIPPTESRASSHPHSNTHSPQPSYPSRRQDSPSQQTSIPTTSPANTATIGPPMNMNNSPLPGYQNFQHQLPIYDPASQVAFVPDPAAPQHPTGPMPPGVILNHDGTSTRYELHSNVYDAFSFVEPMNANMAPAPYDPTWTMDTGPGVPLQ